MKTKILLLLVLVSFLVSPFKGKAQAANVQDSLALVDLYDSTGGPNWLNHTNWLTAAPITTWYGILGDYAGPYSDIKLNKNNLKGTIPASLGKMPDLLKLDLSDNLLTGSIPAEIGTNRTELILYLTGNKLSGAIPSSLLGVEYLKQLFIDSNKFTFSGMEQIAFKNNSFTYAPQDTVLPIKIINAKFSVSAGGTISNNTYNWYNGSTLVKTTTGDSTYAPVATGNYHAVVTNAVANRLTLYSNTFALASIPPPTLDSLALVALYDSTSGATWANNTNWLTSAPVSTWFGVTVANQRVTQLSLNSNNLVGALPPSLGNLTALTSLMLAGNNLAGNIPDSLGNLTNLAFLQLSQNKLTGQIPSTFAHLANLSQVYIADNQLSGTLPSFLGSLGNLYVLFLSNNQFTGTIPTSLGNLNNLIWLYLASNKFSGNIPASLGNLKNLQILFLSNNQLTGNIPSSFSNLVNLQLFGVEINQLSGNIPDFLSKFSTITDLYLNDNQFTGKIPSSFGNLLALTNLQLGNNLLNGSIPDSLLLLKQLKELGLQSNMFTFSGMEAIAQTFGDAIATYAPQADIPIIKNGNIFSVAVGGTPGNNTYTWYRNDSLMSQKVGDSTLTVTSPSDYYYVTVNNSVATQLTLHSTDSSGIRDSLALVDLYNATNGPLWTNNTNWLTKASLNSWYGVNVTHPQSARVLDLELSQNNLAGFIPSTLGRLNKITWFDLSGNSLVDTIPASLGSFGDVTYFALSSNQLTGQIPATLGNFSKATLFMLYGNKLSGSLPANLGNLSAVNYLYLDNNNLTGSIPASFGKLVNLNTLGLSFNKLNGPIPSSLDSLHLQYGLFLQNNQFTFAGMEPIVTKFSFATYAPQANLPITKKGSLLSVSAGGTPLNDTFRLYKNGVLQTTQIGDSVFAITAIGKYNITATNTVVTALTLFSDTTNITTLPVTLINFTASLLKNDAQLNWQTSQEVNADSYTVERSLTGTGFTAIGTVEAAGNSTIVQSYRLTDYNAALLNTTALYYRLKITDKDGNFTYSKIIKIDIGGVNNAFVVYPNPAQNTATVAFTATGAGKYAIEITDIAGKALKRIEGASAVGANTITVNVVNYTQGTYIVKIEGDYVSKQSLKLVKQ